ncbi:MAG TPA: aminopeptidase [Cyanobacteria bacterium UBA11149]|nr:aminopeptidase [Cyanobacteria bacterium UBA11366]HBR72252.1 aminopeptidase [Cyanobacteria bacterium UBA11159]HBS68424.1 aminopeptidase [Cyanobacteria bacterium UBA11153]HBW91916.1 aminopeptidase [Cyanobacteria bacterium UBA11149]HCA94487.1 aminopeptidase [Cyanobacteria bacterium UBA9226]
MSPNSQKKLKIQIITKPALIRLAILFAILLILSIWGWFALFWMPGQSYQGQLPPLQQPEIELRNALQQDVKKLAGDIGIRNFGYYENLNAAANFMETAFGKTGYKVQRQEYKIENKYYYNIVADKIGIKNPNEIVVIGGHYDSVFGSPGANDNGTGAAATLELAKIFAKQENNRTIRFIEFTNEEPPFFWTENMGSLVYAKESRQKQEKIVAMLSLETMGDFSDTKGSQKYPFPIGLFYPDLGNFICFIGNINSGDLVRNAIATFRLYDQFPSEGAVLPNWIPGVGWSDHWSFWQEGYKAIMVTDTAPYRYIAVDS